MHACVSRIQFVVRSLFTCTHPSQPAHAETQACTLGHCHPVGNKTRGFDTVAQRQNGCTTPKLSNNGRCRGGHAPQLACPGLAAPPPHCQRVHSRLAAACGAVRHAAVQAAAALGRVGRAVGQQLLQHLLHACRQSQSAACANGVGGGRCCGEYTTCSKEYTSAGCCEQCFGAPEGALGHAVQCTDQLEERTGATATANRAVGGSCGGVM